MNLNTIFFLVSIVGAILTLLKIAGWLSKAGYNIVKWGAYTILGILVIWGLYNTIGVKLHLWDPISLDQFIYRIPVIGDALKRLDDWLNQFNFFGG
ncbi:MAG: hypothetical protein GXO43_09945 [Crenarchaeota archaeon]|nr:hypothetical protein [Thermoproteota archaeon]